MNVHSFIILPLCKTNRMRVRDTDKEKMVIEQAKALIAEDGIQGFSMKKLAKACDISVATLYIYYSDKDDLIKKIGGEIAINFFTSVTKGFSPDMSFKDGLWKQWENRIAFARENPIEVICFEAMRHSPYADEILQSEALQEFKSLMGRFFDKAITNKEMDHLPLDVFWSVAYGPLYTLLNFHREGKSMGGRKFVLTDQMIQQAFRAVLKALKP